MAEQGKLRGIEEEAERVKQRAGAGWTSRGTPFPAPPPRPAAPVTPAQSLLRR